MVKKGSLLGPKKFRHGDVGHPTAAILGGQEADLTREQACRMTGQMHVACRNILLA